MKISIIIPIYNVEKYLYKCLNTIINQTYRDIEIICVNDSSSDSSGEILRSIASEDSRIKILNKVNEGVSLARNYGLMHATGEYLMFVDADDWLELDTCEYAIKTLKNYSADLVMWSYVRERGEKYLEKKIFDNELIIFDKNACKNKLHRRMIGLSNKELQEPENADSLCTVWGKIYKADIIRNNNLLFEDIKEIGTYEDGLFNLNVLEFVNKAVFINKALYHYRKDNANSITKKYKQNLFEDWKKLFDIMESYIGKKALGEEYEKALENRICLSILGLGLNITYSSNNILWKTNSIKNIINDKRYKKAYSNFELKYLPLKWKIFYGLAKKRSAFSVYILLVIINKIIGGNK